LKPQGYPATVRVRKRPDFQRAYTTGTKRVGPNCVLYVCPNESSVTRLGVTATRKIGNAVRRNRAKRLIREAFRRERANLPTGLDIVVVARMRLPNRRNSEVQAELRQLIPGTA
jgi:ribonuclease P protein component